MNRYFMLLLCLSLLYASVFGAAVSADDSITVRVGTYENHPKIFTDDKGNVSGFWPDIIEYIASEEGWKIDYIHGTWTQCLTRLEKNEIDMMPDVAYTEERSRLYDFSNEAVHVSWSRVYAKQGADIQSILDLEGKNIAVLEGSVNVEGPDGIKELVREFDINCTFTEVDSYTEVFELVESGEADAGVTNKDFAYRHGADFNIVKTAIIFQPASLYFAFPKESNLKPYLTESIDSHMKELKEDEDSIYYQSLEKWLGVKPIEKAVVPGWMIWTLAGIGGLVLLLAGGSFILRSQVRARTKELTAETIERKQAEEELRKTNRVLMVLSQCNQALIHSTNEPQLLNEICRIIVKKSGYRLAWVGFAEQDKAKTVRPVAQQGYEKGYLDTLKITWADTERGRGPTGTAIRTGKPGVFRNILADPHYLPWRAEAEKRGYASSLALPLISEGQAFGTLNIYAAEPDAFDQVEIKLLTEMADDLAYGIMSLRTRAERDRAEANLRTYLESAPDGVYISDTKGTFLYGNKRAEEISGYSKEELIGKSFLKLELMPPEYADKARELLKLNASGKSTGPDEFQLRRKDGTNICVEISTTPVGKDEEFAVVGVVRDITERRKMEEQLIITDRLASVGELAAGIAHELNNPLTSVIGFSDLLLQKDVPDDVREDLQTVNREARRTADIVRNLLTFARRHEAEKAPTNTNKVIENVLALRAYEQKVHNIEIKTDLAPDLPEIKADGFKLQQVFLNIIINAEYFMAKAHGKGTLTINTKRVGDTARISFSDDGPGIPAENLAHLFDPFFTTKEVGVGTGLGLSISHGIIAEHGGRIYAESEVGEGATFIAELPITQ